jgi:hypothetical protein
MWIVLCSSSDYSATWAYEGLRRKGLAPLELLTTESLSGARLWEHRVGAGGAHLKIGLRDGRTICTSRIRGALNRIAAPAPGLIAHAVDSDREYASAEMQSFYLSWLNCLPGVIANKPSPQGLSGGWAHASEWAMRATRCGFNVPPYRQTDLDPVSRGYSSLGPEGAPLTSLIVLDGVGIFGPETSARVTASCRALARMVKTKILGVDLYRDSANEWQFANATPTPWLPAGGEPLLDGLMTMLAANEETGERQ